MNLITINFQNANPLELQKTKEYLESLKYEQYVAEIENFMRKATQEQYIRFLGFHKSLDSPVISKYFERLKTKYT